MDPKEGAAVLVDPKLGTATPLDPKAGAALLLDPKDGAAVLEDPKAGVAPLEVDPKVVDDVPPKLGVAVVLPNVKFLSVPVELPKLGAAEAVDEF